MAWHGMAWLNGMRCDADRSCTKIANISQYNNIEMNEEWYKKKIEKENEKDE
jgi:hypothetical protein